MGMFFMMLRVGSLPHVFQRLCARLQILVSQNWAPVGGNCSRVGGSCVGGIGYGNGVGAADCTQAGTVFDGSRCRYNP